MTEETDAIVDNRLSEIFEFLAKEGFRPVTKSKFCLEFKFEGITTLVNITSTYEQFYSVIVPYIWPIESAEELAWAYKAVNHLCTEKKLVKAFITPDEKYVWIAAESFYEDVSQFLLSLPRIMGMVYVGTTLFGDTMGQLKAGTKPRTPSWWVPQ